MARFLVNLNDTVAEWLAAKIDDSQPTLGEVAQAILSTASHEIENQAGFRRCQCGVLERLASEDKSPVIFDAMLNEYELLRETPHGPAKHQIRYCFWCGDRAPTSKRAQLFAKVAYEEVRRLNALCTGIRTFQEAIDRFGPPDTDRSEGSTTISRTPEGTEEHIPHRVICYESLSDAAQVRFTQRLADLVSVSFTGKYIGLPESR